MTFDNCFEVRPKEMGFLEFALIQYLHKAQKSPKNYELYQKRNTDYYLARLLVAMNSASKKLF